MTYADIAARAGSSEFRAQLSVAIAKCASDIYSEDPATPSHDARIALAKIAADYANNYATRFSTVVAANAAVQAEDPVTDQTLYDATAAVWNLMAGA